MTSLLYLHMRDPSSRESQLGNSCLCATSGQYYNPLKAHSLRIITSPLSFIYCRSLFISLLFSVR
uniref:Ovule protein n=1 Tax=Ascaris lumbricoides TaxID=6252 RepID=A0A0M3HGE1_ASCLU